MRLFNSKNFKVFSTFVQGIMVGFDWDWEFQVVQVDLFIVSFIFMYGQTQYDDFLNEMM